MQMPVIVGIVLAIISLVVFSEWFYHNFVGWKEVIIDDQFFNLRIFGATVVSIFIFFVSFMGAAYVTKCPNEDRTGIFEKLNCEEYYKIKTQTDTLMGQTGRN
jgi:hypothetical protein